MSERDFERGRLYELETLLKEFEALFGDGEIEGKLRDFYETMDGEHNEIIVNLALDDDEGE